MAASAPTIVMPAAAMAHMAVPMAMDQNNRTIVISNQCVCRRPRHRRGGQNRHCRECAGGDADQQQTFHFMISLTPRDRGDEPMFRRPIGSAFQIIADFPQLWHRSPTARKSGISTYLSMTEARECMSARLTYEQKISFEPPPQ